jgi:tetratricopeptide (TPR) repeat protein
MSNCGENARLESDSYMRKKSTNVDSVWLYFESQSDVVKRSEFVMNKYNQLSQNPKYSDSAVKLLKKLTKFAKSNPDPKFLCYYFSLQKNISFLSNNLEQAWYWHNKRVPFEPFAPINNKLSDDIITGNMLYFESKIDSAISALQNALNFSIKEKDTFYRQTILINLGSAYYDVGFYGASSNCFSQAALFSFPTVEYKQVLFTNLLASLNSERKYKEVIKIVKQNLDLMSSATGRRDMAQLYRLNYVSALLASNYDISEVKIQLDSIESYEIGDHLKNFYLFMKGRYLRTVKDLQGFKKLYTDNLTFIYNSQPKSILDNVEGLKFGLSQGLFTVSFNEFHKEYVKITPSETNYLLLANYADIFSSIKKSEGNIAESKSWEQVSDKFMLKMSQVSDELQNSNIQKEMEKVRILQILDQQKYQIEKAEIKGNWLLALSVVFGALLISTALFLYQFNINRKKQLSILELESELKEKELEMLKQNQERQQNTVFTSKLILTKIDELILKIKNSNLSNNPTMVDIKIELERLKGVELPHEGETIEESDIFENYQYLSEKFPSLTEMNSTSYKILVLSILDNAPKDIANLLNLNMQYVRNVRSKLKKELSEEMGENWDWPDLA